MFLRFFRQHSAINHLLVVLQLSGIALCCYPVNFQNYGNKYWLTLSIVGGVLGIATLCYNKIGNFSVYPEIKTYATLIITGPYQYIRHPMYTSLIVMMIGITFVNYHWLNAVVLAIVLLTVISKANTGEKLLLIGFEEYSKYQKTTNRFVPFLY